MMLAGKKVVVVGGSSGIGLATAELARREGADVIVASRNVDRLDEVAARLNAIAIPTDVTSDESVASLFRSCGPVDHVVVTAAQLRTGPFKTVAMEDVRATMEGKFWGAWRVARAAEIRPGGSLTLVSGFLSIRPRPNSADRRRCQWRAGVAGTQPRARTRAGTRQCRVARNHRHPDPRRDAGRGAPRYAGQDGGRLAGGTRRHR